jgi:hypothetical protein
MAKLSAGLCDNLLTCVARAWEVGKKPIVVAPAMNTAMWEHPLVSRIFYPCVAHARPIRLGMPCFIQCQVHFFVRQLGAAWCRC